jgi:hypothetical protein
MELILSNVGPFTSKVVGARREALVNTQVRPSRGPLDGVLKERFEVEVEQPSRHGSVAIWLRDGTRLGALNRG